MGARHTLPSWLTFPSTTLPFLVPISRCKLRHPCLALGSVPACAFKSASSEASNWRRKVPRRTGHRGSGPQSTPSKAPRCPIHDACAGPQAREGRLTCLARRDAYLANPATATSNIRCREWLPGPGQACLRCAALRWGRHPVSTGVQCPAPAPGTVEPPPDSVASPPPAPPNNNTRSALDRSVGAPSVLLPLVRVACHRQLGRRLCQPKARNGFSSRHADCSQPPALLHADVPLQFQKPEPDAFQEQRRCGAARPGRCQRPRPQGGHHEGASRLTTLRRRTGADSHLAQARNLAAKDRSGTSDPVRELIDATGLLQRRQRAHVGIEDAVLTTILAVPRRHPWRLPNRDSRCA